MFNKYHAKKIVIDGITFDSTKEGNRYLELKMLEKNGYIKNLQRQVRFEIVPKAGKNKRAKYYVADFVYEESDKTKVIEDVKSPFTRKLPVYNLKKSIMLVKYTDYDFREY